MYDSAYSFLFTFGLLFTCPCLHCTTMRYQKAEDFRTVFQQQLINLRMFLNSRVTRNATQKLTKESEIEKYLLGGGRWVVGGGRWAMGGRR